MHGLRDRCKPTLFEVGPLSVAHARSPVLHAARHSLTVVEQVLSGLPAPANYTSKATERGRGQRRQSWRRTCRAASRSRELCSARSASRRRARSASVWPSARLARSSSPSERERSSSASHAACRRSPSAWVQQG